MAEPLDVPAGSDLRLGLPSFPPTPPFVAALRRFARGVPAVAAVYVFALSVDDGPWRDVVGIDHGQGGPGGDAAIDRLAETLAAVTPRDLALDLTLVSAEARLAALHVTAPIGAGGDLEDAAARAASDETAVEQLVDVLLGSTLYAPAVAGDAARAFSSGDVPAPRPLQDSERVRYPITRVGGQPAITVFSSWWALLHADPPFPDQLEAPGRRLVANWPDDVALALDPGCLHGILLPAVDVMRIRAAVRRPAS